jgi:hypothetical protein
MVAMDLYQAAAAQHVGPTVTEWILAGAAIASQFVTLYVARRQYASTLAIAKDQNDTALRIANQQNTNALTLAQQQNETALRVARQQVLVNVVSASRRRWMETFRDAVAEYLSTVGAWSAAHQTTSVTMAGFKDTVERVDFLSTKIALLLNPAEEDHRNLTRLMETLLATFDQTHGDPLKVRPIKGEITSLARSILKREWERTKAEPTQW